MCLNVKSSQIYTKEKPINSNINQENNINSQTNISTKPEDKLNTSDTFKNKSNIKLKSLELNIASKNSEPVTHIPFLDIEPIEHKEPSTSSEIKNNVEEKKISIDDVKNAKKNEVIFKLNESGPAVTVLKDRLKQLGMVCGPGDKFDEVTMKSIKNFQEVYGIAGKNKPLSGKVDKNTWNELNNAVLTFKGNSISEVSKDAKALSDAGSAIAGGSLSGGGRCYTGVWNAIVKSGLDKKGINPPATDPARDFNDWALGSGKKVMARVLPSISSDGKTILGLKPGDIVVYEKGVQGHHSLYGHIEIYGGATGKDKNGNTTNVFYSDFKNIQQGTDQIMYGIKNGQIKNGDIKIYRFNPEQDTKPASKK